ncbi:hypothetical protein Taro_049646 [Colocasia esculenta]|uniref:Agenet domain-containing protein n=1 Tax=Colocasia esculenta TaxID=4460 RepID=A0A843XBS4_COLES|nr:hypothetical protein [Colocasia esculenta]
MGERSRRWVRGVRVPGMMFATGDEVEVSSDEEGFRGVWFEAKVVRSMPRADRYMVVYDHLINDDADPRPLRETVDACYVRPRSPRRRGPFGVCSPVDAWHKDGWWAGVVAAVVPAGQMRRVVKYVVCFPSTREEMEFKAADLRHHLEWFDDKWVKPGEHDVAHLAVTFPVGSRLEVSQSFGDSMYAWFIGTVEKLIWKDNLLVKYQHLQASDEGEHLREIVDVQHVRPCPPPGLGSRNFCLLQHVEVFHGDGWYNGVVSEVCSASTYIINSEHWDLEKEFPQGSVRMPHQWTNSCWVPATKNIPEHSEVLYERGTKVEVRSDEEGFRGAWYAATVVKLLSGNRFVVEYEALRTDDDSEFLKQTVDAHHIRPAPNTSVVGKFKRLEEVDAFYNDGWWIGVISKVLEGSRYMVYFKDAKEELEFGMNELRLHMDWINGQWIWTSQIELERIDMIYSDSYRTNKVLAHLDGSKLPKGGVNKQYEI